MCKKIKLIRLFIIDFILFKTVIFRPFLWYVNDIFAFSHLKNYKLNTCMQDDFGLRFHLLDMQEYSYYVP